MTADNEYERKPWLQAYPKEIPAEIQIPKQSIVEAFDRATEKWAKRTAINFYGKEISYGKLREKVDRFATGLSALGVKKGDRVALLLLNSPEHIIAFYGVVKLGAIVTAISPVYVSSEIKHQLLDSGAETLICQDILYEGVEKTGLKLKNVIITNIEDSLPAIKRLMGKKIVRDVYQKMALPASEIFSRSGFYRFNDLIEKYPPALQKVEINPEEDIVTLPYTGGTTGAPKGVMITHQNVMAEITQFHAFLPNLEIGKEVWLAYSPFYHAAGQILSVLDGILSGYTLIIMTTPDPDDLLNLLVKHDIRTLFGAPSLYEILKDYKKTDRINWKKFKMVMSGADALREETFKQWQRRTGVSLQEGYGMTEVTLTATENPCGKIKLGSIGVPICSTLVAILDPEKDEFVPLKEKGEIAVLGPQVTKGYYNNPEATRACEAIIAGKRWWRTGDIGLMDEEGYFYIYDRKRDLIKYKGLRVYAREVEEVLIKHPQIKEVGVIGVPDIRVGENVKALVVVERDARGKLSEEEVMDYCKDKLAHYKIPKIVEFVGEIPKTDVGKVSRRELRELEA